MKSSEYCINKAEMCEARAAACVGSLVETEWLHMSAQWRELAGDDSDQATMARLFAGQGSNGT